MEYYRLPQYAYEDSNDGNKNLLDIDVKLFNDSPDQMDSFLVSPVTGVELYVKDSNRIKVIIRGIINMFWIYLLFFKSISPNFYDLTSFNDIKLVKFYWKKFLCT